MRYIDLIDKYLPLAKEASLEEEAIKLIITEICNINLTELYLRYNEEVPLDKEDILIKSIKKYLSGYPAQYILGYTYFYGLKINVDNNVLIPRFDTEVVVEEAIKLAKRYINPKVLDICCGSGAIAIALAKSGISHVDGVDISKKALEVAINNAKMHNLKIHLFESDLLRNVKEKYDILISNPPYIENNDPSIEKIVLDNEPHIALFGGEDGLDYYRAILKDARHYLNEGGSIVFEIPFNKASAIKKIALNYFNNVDVKKDYAGNDRVMIIN